MTDQQFAQLMSAISVIGKAAAPIAWDSYLVTSGQVQPTPPTAEETSADPGKYYKTAFDPMKGDITSSQVVELFDDPPRHPDAEGNISRPFVGGSYYQWAKADLPAFLRFYQHRNKYPLNLAKLHPEQRVLMGIAS